MFALGSTTAGAVVALAASVGEAEVEVEVEVLGCDGSRKAAGHDPTGRVSTVNASSTK